MPALAAELAPPAEPVLVPAFAEPEIDDLPPVAVETPLAPELDEPLSPGDDVPVDEDPVLDEDPLVLGAQTPHVISQLPANQPCPQKPHCLAFSQLSELRGVSRQGFGAAELPPVLTVPPVDALSLLGVALPPSPDGRLSGVLPPLLSPMFACGLPAVVLPAPPTAPFVFDAPGLSGPLPPDGVTMLAASVAF